MKRILIKYGSITLLIPGVLLPGAMECWADSRDITESLSSFAACTRQGNGLEVDIDGDGTPETLVVINSIQGFGIVQSAAFPGYGSADYFYTGNTAGHCAPSAPPDTGVFSVYFVDMTAPRYNPTDAMSWTLKTVAGVGLTTYSDDSPIISRPLLYRKVSAFSDVDAARRPSGMPLDVFRHEQGDTSTRSQACGFLPACGSPGVKLVWIESHFAENVIQSLVIHSACAPVMLIPILRLQDPIILRFKTLFGLPHRLERSGRLPFWLPAGEDTEGTGEMMEFRDMPQPNEPMALYRLTVTVPVGNGSALVPAGSRWRYLDNGSEQPSSWHSANFNDSQWPSGLAEFGYGESDEATVVSYGPNPANPYITTYFRHTFTVDNPADYSGLSLGLKRDGGAVVYLNGTEVFRGNMPTGAVDYLTLAASPTTGSDETTFFTTALSSNLLVSGNNLIAVEVHQDSSDSSDLSFDLQLSASYAPPQPPTITVQPLATNVKLGNAVTLGVEAVGLAPFSYQWFHDNSAIKGATSATYSIANVQPNDAGTYWVRVSNSTGSAFSTGASVIVQQ